MKTTLDAVKGLKADVNTGFVAKPYSTDIHYEGYCENPWAVYRGKCRGFVCTVADFDQLVYDLSFNFGTSRSYRYYKDNYKSVVSTKTVIDAVNELQGDLNNVAHIKSDETYHCNLNYNIDVGWWCSRGVYNDFVCTIDDFINTVGNMAYNFGKTTNVDFYDYINADKKTAKPQLEEDAAYYDMVNQLNNEGITIYDPIMLKILIEKFKNNKIENITWSGKE